jgi:hypothetical protein
MNYCKNCGTTDAPTRHKRGSSFTEAAITFAALADFLFLTWQYFEPGMHGDPTLVHYSPAPSIGASLLFLFLGGWTIGYMIYRRVALRPSCSKCKSEQLIPADSPIALDASYKAEYTKAQIEIRAAMSR